MKFLVTFVAIILCANAYRLPDSDSISSASSEELIITPPGGQPQPIPPIPDSISSASSSEELLLLPSGSTRISPLPGVGVVSHPVLQAVKVKVPQYGNILNTNRILAQVFGPQEATVQGVRVLG